jgi:hypothetical protein
VIVVVMIFRVVTVEVAVFVFVRLAVVARARICRVPADDRWSWCLGHAPGHQNDDGKGGSRPFLVCGVAQL